MPGPRCLFPSSARLFPPRPSVPRAHPWTRVSAKGEQNPVLRIEGQAGGSAALSLESIMSGHLERLRVHHRDIVLVLDVDVDVTLPIADCLFRRAAQVDRADDRALLCVNHG